MADRALRTGRPRDTAIDAAVLDVALAHLAASGLAGLSVSAVAQEAGTTRPAIYRRWPTKLDLAVAAVAALAEDAPPEPGGDPFADLVAEIAHFRHCISDPGATALAGAVLQDGVDEPFRRQYREHLVVPRRARLRACLDRGVDQRQLDPDADLALAASIPTGSWYALAVGGLPVPDDWAPRIARLVWRACGGSPPAGG
jgi:AcrR family transcriptional regulator